MMPDSSSKWSRTKYFVPCVLSVASCSSEGTEALPTEQVATGYAEEKMEVGAKSSSVLGVSQSEQGGVGLDTMVQRLVQKSVWEIDNKYK